MSTALLGKKQLRNALRFAVNHVPGGVSVFDATDRRRWMFLRAPDITASVAAALWGIHPFYTAYGLWASKSGLIEGTKEETALMRRGRMLEPVILQIIADDNEDMALVSPGRYYRNEGWRIGATPDAICVRADRPGHGIIQTKVVRADVFERDWRDEDGAITSPLWIAVQSTIEAVLTGASYAYVSPFVLTDNSFEAPLIEVPIRPALITRLRLLVDEFWGRVASGNAYDPDFGRDAETIAAVHGLGSGMEVDVSFDATIATLIDMRDGLVEVEAQGRAARKERDAIDAQLRHKIAPASLAIAHGGRILEIVDNSREGGWQAASKSTSLRVRSAPRAKAHFTDAVL